MQCFQNAREVRENTFRRFIDAAEQREELMADYDSSLPTHFHPIKPAICM
jgi:hypothetical protein